MLKSNILTEALLNEKNLSNIKNYTKLNNFDINFINNEDSKLNISDFSNELLEKYYNIFIKNQKILNVTDSNKYKYRPEYVQYDFYNDINLYWVILYVNKCTSAIDFNKRNIIVPQISDIYKLFKEKYKNTLNYTNEKIFESQNIDFDF